MTLSTEIRWGLQIGCGVFWTLAYILIIKRGFQDNTFGMPIVALCANISWEFIFSFVHPHSIPQVYINVIWFLFDVVILYQVVRFGRAAVNELFPERYFYPAFILSLFSSFGMILSITHEFNDWHGRYTAFGQNFMLSVLFVLMLLRRNDVSGQSVYIAVFKMLGTVLSSILFYLLYPSSFLLNFFYIAIFVFDWLYLILLYTKHQELGINPWRRF